MTRVIALDFDGVILESNSAKTFAFAEVMRGFGPQASAAMLSHHLENRGVSRYAKFDWFYRTFLDRDPTDGELADLNSRFNTLSMEAILRAPFVAGVEDLLERFSGRMPLYVVSGTPQPEINQIVGARNLGRFFRKVLGTPVTKAEHLRNILVWEKAAPDEVLMVGDADTDLNAALETGVRFYGRGDFPGHPCAPDLRGLPEFLGSCLETA